MPIRPENKSRYPKNWKSEIRPRILKRANNRCEQCGVANHDIGYRDENGEWRPVPWHWKGEEAYVRKSDKKTIFCIEIILTIAHLHDPIEDCSDENLLRRESAPTRICGRSASFATTDMTPRRARPASNNDDARRMPSTTCSQTMRGSHEVQRH